MENGEVKQLLLLSDLTEEINAGKTLDEILDATYRRLGGMVPCSRVAVALVDESEDALKMVALRTDGTVLLGPGYRGRLRGSSLEGILKTGTPRIINDLEQYLKRKPDSASTKLIVQEGMRASLTLPLVVRGKPVGVMFFSSRNANAYTEQHVSFLKLISGHMAIAVEKTLLLQQLKDKGDYLENILRSSADAIVVVDRDNVIRSWNRGAELIFGYSEDEAVGNPKSMLLSPELVRAGEVERFQQRIEKDGYVTGYETEGLTKDGRRIPLSVTSTLIRDAEGRAVGRCSILRDLTAIKRLQTELVHAQSLAVVGELAASVAHEIKNPLAGISGAVQILCRSFPENDSRRMIANELLQQVKRLDNTVRDLLIFARPWTPQPRRFNLSEFIDSVLARAESQENGNGVRFVRELPAKCMVTADPQLLEHVLVNLLMNALDAVSGSGTISVKVSEQDATVRIEVRDTGVGIPPQYRDRLFKPFFSTKTRGTGLGLAISKRVVDAHHGSISIDSAAGKGTTVRILLPRDLKER